MENLGILSVLIFGTLLAAFAMYSLLTVLAVYVGEDNCKKLNNVYECKMMFVPKEVEDD